MGDDFVVRAAEMGDAAAIEELIAASVRGLQPEYTEAEREAALGRVFGVDTQLLRDGTYFVVTPAGEPGRLVACGGWSYRQTLFGADGGPGREPERLDAAVDAAKVRAIFVRPGWERRGLGSLVLGWAEEAARAAGFRRVEMGSTLAGVALYTLRGYREVERVAVGLEGGVRLAVVRMERALAG